MTLFNFCFTYNVIKAFFFKKMELEFKYKCRPTIGNLYTFLKGFRIKKDFLLRLKTPKTYKYFTEM